ncbi:unnamed protein product [Amoebophrya sp. A120]|nr:unnamed protein product [Amoebophrya sp. A120]|eukprot:GSA120T00015669001.1
MARRAWSFRQQTGKKFCSPLGTDNKEEKKLCLSRGHSCFHLACVALHLRKLLPKELELVDIELPKVLCSSYPTGGGVTATILEEVDTAPSVAGACVEEGGSSSSTNCNPASSTTGAARAGPATADVPATSSDHSPCADASDQDAGSEEVELATVQYPCPMCRQTTDLKLKVKVKLKSSTDTLFSQEGSVVSGDGEQGTASSEHGENSTDNTIYTTTSRPVQVVPEYLQRLRRGEPLLLSGAPRFPDVSGDEWVVTTMHRLLDTMIFRLEQSPLGTAREWSASEVDAMSPLRSGRTAMRGGQQQRDPLMSPLTSQAVMSQDPSVQEVDLRRRRNALVLPDILTGPYDENNPDHVSGAAFAPFVAAGVAAVAQGQQQQNRGTAARMLLGRIRQLEQNPVFVNLMDASPSTPYSPWTARTHDSILSPDPPTEGG